MFRKFTINIKIFIVMGKKLIIRGANWIMDALNFKTIGAFFESLVGLPKTNLGFTYVYKEPLPAGKIYFYYQSETDGTAIFDFKLFTKSGNTLTQDSFVTKTVQKNTWVDLGLIAQEGQYLGAYGGDSGIAYEASQDPTIPHLAAAAGNVTTVDYSTDFATHFSFVFGIKTE